MKKQVVLCFLSFISQSVSAEGLNQSVDQQTLEQKTTLLGRELSVKQQYGTTSSGLGAEATTKIKFIGNGKPLMDASLEYIGESLPGANGSDPLQDIINNTKHDYYIKGIRVWSDDMGYKDGSFYYTGGVAPTAIPIPVLEYPVGPMVLELVSGVEFEAMLDARLTPGISIPVEDSTLTASLKAQVAASGFVEGGVRILILRAGVGGSIGLIEADATVAAKVFFKKAPPQLTYGGQVMVLNGRIYAFVDTNIFFGKWKKLLSYDLYSWKGKCWAFGAQLCKTN